MNLIVIIRIALSALMRNRMRSLLTMLGVIIGVSAVIITVAIGAGGGAAIQKRIEGLGSNLINIFPGSTTQGGARSGLGGSSSLTVDDGLEIAKLPYVAAVSPLVQVRAQAVSGGQNWQTSVVGVASTYTFIRNWQPASGAFFTQSDVASAAKVAILGQTVVQNLFPDGSSPIGKIVLIKGIPFTVIGTMTTRGQNAFGSNEDDSILIPFSSAMQRLSGNTMYVSQYVISASDEKHVDAAQSEITTLLEQRHRIVQPENDDFAVMTAQEFEEAVNATAAILEVLLSSIAAVSLVVGGIGIMNIMLVSVTERTREIGLRMAIGARGSTILQQFLTEAVVLSTAGGVIGITVGALGALLLSAIFKWPAVIPLGAVVLSILFSAAVGIFFGFYPAKKAAMLNPIDALRFE